jgi:hypothetical protein
MTREDLEQIRKLFEAERGHTRNIVREVVDVNNKVLGTIFRIELSETNRLIDTIAKDTKELQKGQKQLEQKLDKTIEDHEERITQLEAAGLTHKN